MYYKIATPISLYDIDVADEEQYLYFSNMLTDYLPNRPAIAVLFNNAFSNGTYLLHEDVNEILASTAIKDGVDYIQYEDGHYGFVSYYGDNKTFVMFIDESESLIPNCNSLHSDFDFIKA